MKPATVTFAAWACACGPSAASGTGASGGGTGHSGDAGGADAMVSADGVGSTEAGDTTGDSEGTASTGGDSGGVPVGLCGATADQLVAVAVHTDTGALTLMAGDGTTVLVDGSANAAPSGAVKTFSTSATDDWVAILSAWSNNLGQSSGFTIRVLDAQGATLWERDEGGFSTGPIWLAADGSVTVSVTSDGPPHGVLFGGPTGDQILSGVEPVGPLREDGLILSRQLAPVDPGPLGYLDVATGMFTALSLQPVNAWLMQRRGAVVYRTEAAIVVADPDGFETIDLDAAEPTTVTATQQDWLIVRLGNASPWVTTWARVSLQDGTFEPFELTPPRGAQFLECSFDPQIDGDGTVFAPTFDATAAQLQGVALGFNTWEPVAAAVTSIGTMDTRLAGETVMVHTTAAGQTFCPAIAGEPAEDLLEGEQWQVLNNARAVQYILPPDTQLASLSPDGRCVVHRDEDDAAVLDVFTGEQHSIDLAWTYHAL